MAKKKAIKNGAIYLRTSDESVSNKDLSLDAQEKSCTAFCEALGIKVSKAHIYRDIAPGAQVIRPGLQAMLKAAEQNEFETVVVYKLDRLARSLALLLSITKALSEVKVQSATENLDMSTPFGALTMQILGIFAEMNSDRITRKTQHLRGTR